MTLVIQKFLPQDILIIVEHITIEHDKTIKLRVTIERNMSDNEGIWKRVFPGSLDDTDEIRVEKLISFICLIFRDRSDDYPRESRTEIIHEYLGLQTRELIATLIVDRELDPRLHIRNKLF